MEEGLSRCKYSKAGGWNYERTSKTYVVKLVPECSRRCSVKMALLGTSKLN